MPIDMKSVIAETFGNMVRQGNIDKITVKALIEECHISRQTFYYHFKDIMDVLEWTMQQVTAHLVEKSRNAESMRDALKIFISFYVEHFPMLRKLMQSQRRAQIEKLMVDAVVSYMSELSQYRPVENVSINYKDREVLLQYNACGLVGVLMSYGGRPNLDQDLLAEKLEKLLAGELSAWNEA